MEPNSHKKIQFAVPLFQSQIDPEAAEQIRKRRPTPASLVIMTESPSQNASPKQRKQSVYTPPAMKAYSYLKHSLGFCFPSRAVYKAAL
uniref:Protein phosphatase 1 regulatory inhibitor subunit 1C n=1 Tax=Sphenodon punctatus TaxID=8508 RepID=A0A8D0HRU1_SPHPU